MEASGATFGKAASDLTNSSNYLALFTKESFYSVTKYKRTSELSAMFSKILGCDREDLKS